MDPFKIGTLADWFGVGLIEGIKMSEKVGAQGVQLYAMGELHPETMTPSAMKTIRRTISDCNQTVTALCGELGGHGLCRKDENEKKLDYLKKTILLAKELDCSIVTTHLGVVPGEKGDAYKILLDACNEIGRFAAEIDACIAVETGPESIERLKAFCLDCDAGIRINYDPANLAMVLQADPVAGVYEAGDLIVHTHAKDGLNLKPTTGEYYYGVFAEKGLEGTRALGITQQVPLGQGAVKWPAYLKALKDIGFDGFLTIEREAKEAAGKDIADAVVFLREQMKTI